VEDSLRSLQATEPALAAPGGTVQLMTGDRGLHVVFTFRAELAEHHLLGEGMEEVLDFATAPGVDRIAPLVAWDRAAASFAYPVPPGRLLAWLPDEASPRAALQLVALLAPVLAQGATAARSAGLYAHGALSPWRVWLGDDGTVTLLGYGLAPVEQLAWLDEEIDDAPTASLRYAPPERIDDKGEDLRSDLFSLAMMAAERAVGGPLLDGPPDRVLDGLVAGTAIDRLDERGEALHDDALDLLAGLLEPDLKARPKAGEELAELARLLMQGAAGSSLEALLAPQPEPQAQPQPAPQPQPTPEPPPVRAAAPAPAPPPAAPPQPTPAPAPPRSSASPSLPASLDELPAQPDLSAVKAHGQQIVARSKAMAEAAAAALAQLRQRASEADDGASLVASAAQHAERAAKAAASAGSASSLLELDEDAAGALITLDLVRNAEQQCQQSASEVLEALAELDRALERQKQQARALAEAARRAQGHADRATDFANRADDLVTALEDDTRSGALAAEGIDEVLAEATAAAERSHGAAEAAREQADEAAASDRLEVATRCADAAQTAAEQAETGWQATADAAQRARKLEDDHRADAAARASEHAAEAAQAAEQAQQALSRADEAIALAPGDESEELRQRCQRHAETASAASASASTAARAAEAAPTSAGASAGAVQASQAAARAKEALHEARQLSDRVVQLAGEAAERKAALSKAREEAESLAEQAHRAASRAREEVDKLFDDTRGVSGERAVTLRAEALEFVQSAERGARKCAGERSSIASLEALAAIEPHLAALRDQVERVASSARRAHERAAEARDQAERELAELRRQEAARQAAAEAAAEARAHADTSRDAVKNAWVRAREVEAFLQTAPHADAEQLKRKALEIIDIAEFQAGEAASSAAMAEGETDPAEARAHAQTAESFAERIALDLPEAIHALDEAEALARKEVTDRERARSHTAEVYSSVQALVKGLRRVVDEARDDAVRWSEVASVAANLSQLEALAAELDADLTEAEYARDRARQVDEAAEALTLVPVADAALQRARAKDQRAEALREALSKAVQQAATEASALEEARRAVTEAADAAADALTIVRGANQRIAEAIDTHDAQGSDAHDAALSIRAATERVAEAHEQLQKLVQVARQADDPAVAGRAAEGARKLAASVERDREQVADDEARGVAAAAQEARARAEAARRRLAAAHDAAEHHVQRAHQVVQRLDELLDEAEDEAAEAGSPEAKARFEQALDEGDQLRARVAEVERSAATARDSDEAEAAEALAAEAAAAADLLAQAAQSVQERVQEARDLARAAAEEAEALAQVKDELASMVDKANEEVARAKAEAKRILGILREAPRSEVKAVAAEVTQHVQTATNAAAKVRAAAPLAASADDLAVAQNILRTSRLALQRGSDAADAVADLITSARERVRLQQEAQAQALDAARARAVAPVQEAEAERLKAEGWLEAGRKLAEAHPERSAIQRQWALLQAKAEALQRAVADTHEAAAPAEQAATLEAAAATEASVRAAADAAVAAAGQVRDALATLRSAADELAERLAQLELTRQETQDNAHAAEQAAEQAELTARELQRALDEHPEHHDVLVRFVEPAQQGAKRATEAAEQARAAATAASSVPDPDDVEDLADEVHAAMAKALDGLEKVAVCEVAFAERRDKLVAAAREAEARAQREKAAAEAQAARAAAEAQQAEEAQRRERDEERRERFRRRRQERVNVNATAALDADTLRSRLKSKRPSDAAPTSPDAAEERPRRAVRRRSRPDDDRSNASLRGVRSWSPNTTSGEPTAPSPSSTPARPSRPRRAARPRPERSTDPNETKADALLERLRARQRDED
jgi:hypothetical protein